MKRDNMIQCKEYYLFNEYFLYKSGKLYWRKKPSPKASRVKIGHIAGTLRNSGYRRIKIFKEYMEHRVIFCMFRGFMPETVDHIDGNKSNNKLENLREATKANQQWNRVQTARNLSGHKNVSLLKNGKYKVRLFKNKKYFNYGTYDLLPDAIEAAMRGRLELHGEFANHGNQYA